MWPVELGFLKVTLRWRAEIAALVYLKHLAHLVTFWLQEESKYLSPTRAC